MLRLYNSLTRRKDLFVHSKNKPIKLYVCGITPYDTTHLGHAFTYVFFDVLARYLGYKGYKVNYVQNVTDIDDDILREAKKKGVDWREFGNVWTKQYLSDMKALNVLRPTHLVRATDSITMMIRIIRGLLNKGIAYEREGNIYFETQKFKKYGLLSRFSREQMLLLAKERGGNPDDQLKKNPLDFILWQVKKEEEPSWESPWGLGRPGWHIECSAMIHEYLGKQLDIHGGGRDLIYPHHESEIAQSQVYTGKRPFCRFFLHTAMVLHNGKKMSKSLGNLVLMKNLLTKYSPNAIRWYLLSHHYRRTFKHDRGDLKAAQDVVEKIEKHLLRGAIPEAIKKKFDRKMDDDLSTPSTLEILRNYPYESIFKILGFVVKS